MNNIETEIRKWIELIQIGKLEKVVEDIQATTFTSINEKTNKHIFKLLLILSHTADKCDKQNYSFGKEIYRLTRTLCSILSIIPDSNKFVSSLFHIVRCLLTMYMYNEAFEVCSYLKGETLVYTHEDVSDLLGKVACLWHNAAKDTFIVLQNDPNIKHYYKLKEIIRYELDTIQIAHESYTKHLLMKISSHLDRTAVIDKKLSTCFKDFCAFVIEYLHRTKLTLNSDERYAIPRYMVQIITRIICENMNERCLISITKDLNTVSDHFKNVLLEDGECYQSLQEFESLYHIYMKPVGCLEEADAKSIRKFCDNYKQITKRYGYTGITKWAIHSIVQILESLFTTYWDRCVRTGRKMFLESGVLLETMNLIDRITVCFVKQTLDKCNNCRDNECMVKVDMYNPVVIRIRCLTLINKLSKNDLSRDICALVVRFMEQNVAHICEMMEFKCKCWTYLWCTCGALIYNLGIMSECYYKESVSLYSLFYTSIIQLEGIQAKSRYIKLKNPIYSTLHRLSVLHYSNGMYEEAMITSALNGLLSYNDVDSKAFRMWANIKYKSTTSNGIMDVTMLSCLKANKAKSMELGFSVELSQYDLVEMCLREAKGLQEAKVNLSSAIQKVLSEMTALKASPMQYARAVQMLAYHLLHFDHDEDILDYLKRAISNLKRVEMNNSVLCLQANLEFYIFVSQLRAMCKKTKAEMENTKFALYAPKVSEIGEGETHDVIPTYTMINTKEDSRIMMHLQTPLKKWNKYFKQNIEDIANDYEPKIILHTLIIAGEYAHLYRYKECESSIWKLAYKLAFKLQDNQAIIYVTGRSISLRDVDHKWVTTAKELAVKLKNSDDENIINAIAVFWISLSDFYIECDMYDEARKLLDTFKKLPGISFTSNIAIYLYSLDRILYNCYLYKENVKYEEYIRYNVEALYTMIHLNDELCARQWKPQDKYLFGFDILLTATVNLSLRMNSLLAFREIGAHLVRRLQTAQKLGATTRVVEILKSLCYIDLSRSQLNDCEVKLQGLEHILNIETFKAIMNNNPAEVVSENVLLTPVRVVDPIRDVPRNDASPVLRKKAFNLPEFTCHTVCDCYACRNISYRYLVFVSTHIRAQLYVLQKNFTISLQHFTGAFKIKESLMKIERCMSKDKNGHFAWQERFFSIDYILLLVNFVYFLRSHANTGRDKVEKILRLALRLCDVYELKGHPIYMSIKELMFDEYFQKIFNSSDYSTFTVPDPSDIDISKYMEKSEVEGSICVTPSINNPRTKKPVTLRRNRTPPLLKLTKINMNFSDDEDNSSPPLSDCRRTKTHRRLTRRKLLGEEYSDSSCQMQEQTGEPQNMLFFKEFLHLKENCFSNIRMKDIVNKITLMVPNISEYLYEVIENMDEPVTHESIKKLIKMIEDFQVNATSQKYTTRKRLTNDHKINEVIAFFKDITIDEPKCNVNLTIKSDLTAERNTLDVYSFDEQCETSGENNRERLNQNYLPLNNVNKLDDSKKTYAGESSRTRITRNSTKHSVVNKEMNNEKTRKSKKKLLS